MEEVPDFGAVFTFGKSKFGDNNANKFWVKNDPIVAVACGDEHTAVVTNTGRAYTFGSNQWGQLALGHTNQTNKPSFVKSLKGTPLTHVACGRAHTLFAAKNGTVFACGGNGEHQVSENNEDEISKPLPIPALQGIPVSRLSCGVEHSLMLSSEGNVYLWGSGSEGQLGMGSDVTELLKPVMLEFTSERIIDASCGYYHTALVTQSGKIFTCGESEGGKLGLGEGIQDTYFTPQPVFLIETAMRVCCGSSCTAIVTTTGSLYMCGDGERGQLGISGSVISAHTLAKVPCPQVIDIAVGEGHTAVVTKSGHLYTFGDGRHGKLAHNEENFSNLFTPYLVESFSLVATVTGVACGGCHTMVMARPGRDRIEKEVISSARSKRHAPPRLNQGTLPPISKSEKEADNIPTITVEQASIISLNKENIGGKNNINKIAENVFKKNDIVNIEEKKKDEKRREKKDEDKIEKKDKIEDKVKKEDRSEKEEDDKAESESVTDEAGESEVTDSEETESEDDTEKTDTKTLVQEKKASPGVIQVKSSASSNSTVYPVTSTTTISISSDTDNKPKGPGKSRGKVEELKEEESETETDEEGEDTEDEDEEDVTEEKETETLVSKMKDAEGAKKEKEKDKIDPTPQEKQEEKTSKFKFWKKKKPEPEEPIVPTNQHNSKTCTIL